jgi:putative tricarboxylic transport membrane protein
MTIGESMRRIAILVAALTLAGSALAQSNALKIIHGSNAGAPQDVMLRLLAEEMQKAINQPVIVEPRPGASGQVAMSALKQAAADGRTIFSDGTGITSILQLPGATHSWMDFEPLYRIQLDPFALYVNPKRFPDWKAALAEMRAKPGQFRVGGFANGGPHQITLMLATAKADATFDWIPYDSGAKAITAVMGDHLEGSMSNISVYAQFKERTAVIAHTSAERLAQFPQLPTFKELGIDVVRYHWRGMFVKRGTPEPVITKLFESVGAGVKSAKFQQYLRESGTLDGTMTRAAYAEMLAEQARGDTVVLKQLKLVQ